VIHVAERRRATVRDTALVTGLVGCLLSVPAAVAWATGLGFVFPSLGPTAYVLAAAPDDATADARHVLGGHVVGVLAGLAAYHAVAGGAALSVPGAAFDPEMGRLAASGVLATAATAAGMRVTDTVHPPACATTLIVSLGLLSTPRAGVVVVAAVALLYAVARGAWALTERPAPG
jgi:hypothetical protein